MTSTDLAESVNRFWPVEVVTGGGLFQNPLLLCSRGSLPFKYDDGISDMINGLVRDHVWMRWYYGRAVERYYEDTTSHSNPSWNSDLVASYFYVRVWASSGETKQSYRRSHFVPTSDNYLE